MDFAAVGTVLVASAALGAPIAPDIPWIRGSIILPALSDAVSFASGDHHILTMRGALVGAGIVGLIRALSIVFFPEFEVIAIYVIVIGVLIFRPVGLFGRSLA